MISPVWLQIIPSTATDSDSKTYSIGGTHDIDKKWVNDVKKKNTLVVPRVLFDKVRVSFLRNTAILFILNTHKMFPNLLDIKYK